MTIELPTGYELEAGEGPQPFSYPNYGVGYDATFRLLTRMQQKYLQAKRELTFNRVYLEQKYYEDFKKIMDFIHLMDNHLLSLRRD